MKKIRLVFAITTILLFSTGIMNIYAQIEFENVKNEQDWAELLKAAEKQKKLIFLDIYATWCGPCKYIDQNVYPLESVGKVYNKYYLNVKIDGETEFGRKLARKFKLTAYPSMYYLSPEEVLITKIVGVKQGPELSAFGEKIYQYSDKILDYHQGFEKNDLTASELKDYYSILSEIGEEEQAMKLSRELVKNLDESEILDSSYIEFILKAPVELDSRIFSMLKDKREQMIASWGAENMETLFSNIYSNELYRAVEEESTERMERILNEFIPVYMQGDSLKIRSAQFATKKLFFANTLNWDEYNDAVLDMYQQYNTGDDMFLYQQAYEVASEHNAHQEAIANAINWMKEAISLNDSFDNHVMMIYLLGIDTNFKLAREYLNMLKQGELTAEQEKVVTELDALITQAEAELEQDPSEIE